VQERGDMSIESRIRTHLANNVLFTGDEFEFEDDDSLLDEGIIDSIGVMELVLFVKQDFGITVDDRDVTLENFDSVNKLASFIRRKSSETAESAG
jgi:acyl carrier protein